MMKQLMLPTVQRGQRAREQHARHAQPEGERIGDDHVIQVDEGRTDEGRAEQHAAEGLGGREKQPAGEEERGRERFDERIPETETPAAAAGPAPQHKPAQNRDIVVPLDRRAAGAVRARGDHRLTRRDPVNADVEKAADAGAEQKARPAGRTTETAFANLTNGLVLHPRFENDYTDSGLGHNGAAGGTPTFVAGVIGTNAVQVNTVSASKLYNYVWSPPHRTWRSSQTTASRSRFG